MIDIDELNISDAFGTRFLYITFTVHNMQEPQERYCFDLFKATNQSELFSLVAEDLLEFRYCDYGVNLLNPDIFYYYKIRITDKETGDVSWSQPKRYLQEKADRWAFAIEEIERKYIECVVDNREVYLLQRRHTGTLCPYCYNPNREASDDDFCPMCFGTHYKYGFYQAQPILVNYYNAPSMSYAFSPKDDADRQSDIQLWTRNFPKMENEDILIDGEKRYIVQSKSDTIKNHFIIRQIATCSLIPKTSILYQVPFNPKKGHTHGETI